jgi:hypothetical protein
MVARFEILMECSKWYVRFMIFFRKTRLYFTWVESNLDRGEVKWDV